METIYDFFFDQETGFQWTLLTVLVVIAMYQGTRWLLKKKEVFGKASSLMRQVVLFLIILTGLVAVVVSLPINDEIRKEVISVFGIVISAAFALSSTTLLSNVFSGLVNRITQHFQAGDYVRINDHFGRITDAGLFHVEVQNESRNLVSFPHHYMTTHPIEVIRESGTILLAEVSLGYDVSRQLIESTLLAAAKDAGLKQPFVFITSLGDFSVVYRVHGLCKDLRRLLTVQSRLYAKVLDHLHEAGIEIVSPGFVNQNPIGEKPPFIPEPSDPKKDTSTFHFAEEVMFEKGMLANLLTRRTQKVEELKATIKETEEAISNAETEAESLELENKLKRATDLCARLEIRMEDLKKRMEEE